MSAETSSAGAPWIRAPLPTSGNTEVRLPAKRSAPVFHAAHSAHVRKGKEDSRGPLSRSGHEVNDDESLRQQGFKLGSCSTFTQGPWCPLLILFLLVP